MTNGIGQLLTAGALLAFWSFCIWGVVLAFKSIVKAVGADFELFSYRVGAFLSSAWSRGRNLAGFLVGAASGPFAVPMVVSISGLELAAPMLAWLPAVGAFLGLGAGSVAAKMHDAFLWRADHAIRGE